MTYRDCRARCFPDVFPNSGLQTYSVESSQHFNSGSDDKNINHSFGRHCIGSVRHVK